MRATFCITVNDGNNYIFNMFVALCLNIDNDVFSKHWKYIKRYESMLILCAILLMEICSGVELPMVSGEY